MSGPTISLRTIYPAASDDDLKDIATCFQLFDGLAEVAAKWEASGATSQAQIVTASIDTMRRSMALVYDRRG